MQSVHEQLWVLELRMALSPRLRFCKAYKDSELAIDRDTSLLDSQDSAP